jgi:hypothetical protein
MIFSHALPYLSLGNTVDAKEAKETIHMTHPFLVQKLEVKR